MLSDNYVIVNLITLLDSKSNRSTCSLASRIPVDDPGAPEWTSLFFHRLSIMYGEFKRDDVKVITLFAPYSDMMPVREEQDPMDVWRSELQRIQRGNATIVDMRDALDGPENAGYFYDILHLNKYGAEEFTYLLAERLRELKPVILNQQN